MKGNWLRFKPNRKKDSWWMTEITVLTCCAERRWMKPLLLVWRTFNIFCIGFWDCIFGVYDSYVVFMYIFETPVYNYRNILVIKTILLKRFLFCFICFFCFLFFIIGSLIYEKLGEKAFGWPGKIGAFVSITMQNIGGKGI